ncbi:long-chain fatty acid--CoA ligase [Streptomyces malaysiensis]|uniref:long-chain fatty acid--CoA ligase n=1 Tax=Streptomyces malaysiensis TaxID=92644 RepID=UPI002B2D74A5|nr:long-chain fatty acid--CoA ligase [Streptomyces malaysiensis]
MRSTMQEGQLTLSRLVDYSRRVFADTTVSTWNGAELETVTFGQIGDRAAQFAHALAKLGVAPGDRVATFLWNNDAHQVAYGAVPAMGAVLHTINLRVSAEQAVYVIRHADDKVIVVDATVAPMLARYMASTPNVEHVIVANGPASAFDAPAGVTVHQLDELIAGEPTSYAWPELSERAAAAMCYTSGTTGDPKGIVYSHRSCWLHAMQVCMRSGMGLSQGDSVLAVVPMFHAMSWGIPYAAMMAGAALVMPGRFLQPEPLLAMMAAGRPTFAAAVPSIWQGVSAQLDVVPQDISHLRAIFVGGSAVPHAMIRKFDGYRAPITHGWGMTETSPLGSVAHPPAGLDDERAFGYRVTQGRILPAMEARLIGEDGAEQPWDGDSVGELEVRGPWVTGAYYSPDGAAADDSKFHDGWLRTGDVAHITSDGYLTLVDRTKDLIKTGGEWISSVELENLVMSSPAVIEAAVVAVPDEKWGERPFVLAVVKDPADRDACKHRAFLAATLPRWQLPERWAFVEEVPKTSVGKFDKMAIRAIYAEGAYEVVEARD